MNKLIQSLKNVMSLEKPRFVLICCRIAIGFLFFVATLFPYFKMIQFDEVVSRLSSAQVPAGWIFILLTWGLMVGYLYVELTEQSKLKKPALIAQAAQASALWLWGMMIFVAAIEEAKLYPEASVALGFGFWFELICIALLWFVAFGEKILLPIIHQFVPVSHAVDPVAEVPVEPQAEPEKIVELEVEPSPIPELEPAPAVEPEVVSQPEPEAEPVDKPQE